ncbi:hypothetical protein [Burkholderia sp. Bp9140]|uniref:hypothetical protein n=1 Tax=Burkholderia sp. Bp9140 TaxID=2184572 RepID=UPI001625F497|nr:hypothetical protein [Burkholderia sp. Bp9140]
MGFQQTIACGPNGTGFKCLIEGGLWRILVVCLTLNKVDIAEYDYCSAVAMTRRKFSDESGTEVRAEK